MKKYSQFINFNIYLWTSKTEEVEEPIDEEAAEDKKSEGADEDKKEEEKEEEKKDEDKEKEDKDDEAEVEEESEEKEKKPKTKKVTLSLLHSQLCCCCFFYYSLRWLNTVWKVVSHNYSLGCYLRLVAGFKLKFATDKIY